MPSGGMPATRNTGNCVHAPLGTPGTPKLVNTAVAITGIMRAAPRCMPYTRAMKTAPTIDAMGAAAFSIAVASGSTSPLTSAGSARSSPGER